MSITLWGLPQPGGEKSAREMKLAACFGLVKKSGMRGVLLLRPLSTPDHQVLSSHKIYIVFIPTVLYC